MAAPVGARERDLYALRAALFGATMRVVTECGACGEVVEFDLDALQLSTPPQPSRAPARVAHDGWELEYRVPTVADLGAVADTAADAAEARRLLAARCVTAAWRDGEPRPVEELPEPLPEPLVRRLAEAAERADPGADLTLKITCPECGATTPAALDIASHLWTELDSWARDLLLDVHLLALAYGWSESSILALSPLRRRYYLELCADA
ncbi:hypothetical protein SAMN06297387_110172 [Streptomyces zhaozhouensis]|uniref:Phage baseplate protein n=1 Tax=Streptomyces zhaozhouensis TaxID=1300267 RepID=A0A286DXT5_9ACTN|nr:hypothetical protein [Streptomyces zhaozhouensis]SOD63440.1 hypothetical protein SAMN06297387_110172 [Streptomyces zhaozhouensis]